MGYYTRYTVEVLSLQSRAQIETFATSLEECNGIALDELSDSMKWYDHEQDVTEAMQKSGVDLVLLHGEGEDQGDVWDKHFLRQSSGEIEVNRYDYHLVRDLSEEDQEAVRARVRQALYTHFDDHIMDQIDNDSVDALITAARGT